MSDVVVTVPKRLWKAWLAEGDLAGRKRWSGRDYYFRIGKRTPKIKHGERVYIVAHGRLRGYAPLLRVSCPPGFLGPGPIADGLPYDSWEDDVNYLVRRAGAVAVTIRESIKGFQGYRYRWWNRKQERPFPSWQTEGVTHDTRIKAERACS
jgi:hypothetical protein